MIIKLATLSLEEEKKLRSNLERSAVRGANPVFNFVHPAVLVGAATGNFAGSEIGDRIFGGTHHMHEATIPGSSIKERLVKTPPGLTGRLGKNLFRAGMGAVGAGIAGMGVMAFRKHKEKKS